MSATVTPIGSTYRGSAFVPPNQATCDAGDCDEETRALVFDEDAGTWLSMCETHTIHELGGHTQADVEGWE